MQSARAMNQALQQTAGHDSFLGLHSSLGPAAAELCRSAAAEEYLVVSLAPVPEVRAMVEVAKRFAAGEVHFTYMVGPTEQCLWWSKVHGAHPAILALAAEWQLLADRVWNEWGQHGPGVHLPVEEFRRRVAGDLGVAPDAEPGAAPDAAR